MQHAALIVVKNIWKKLMKNVNPLNFQNRIESEYRNSEFCTKSLKVISAASWIKLQIIFLLQKVFSFVRCSMPILYDYSIALPLRSLHSSISVPFCSTFPQLFAFLFFLSGCIQFIICLGSPSSVVLWTWPYQYKLFSIDVIYV